MRSGLNGVEPLTKGSYFWKRSKDSRLRKSPDQDWLVYPLPSRSKNTTVDWLSCLLFMRLALRFLRHRHVEVFDSQNGRKSRERGIIPFRERVRKRRWGIESEKQGYLPKIAHPSPYSRAAFVPLLRKFFAPLNSSKILWTSPYLSVEPLRLQICMAEQFDQLLKLSLHLHLKKGIADLLFDLLLSRVITSFLLSIRTQWIKNEN